MTDEELEDTMWESARPWVPPPDCRNPPIFNFKKDP